MASPRELFARRRLTVDLATPDGVADVLFFGRYNNANAQPGLARHRHEGALEICYLVRGRQTYRVGGRDYRLSGGDVFVTFPGEWHDTGGRPQEKGVLYWIALRVQPMSGPFLGHTGSRGAALRSSLLALPARHFRGSPCMQEHLDALFLACHHEPPGPLRAVAMANRVEAFALEVIARAGEPAHRAGPGALAPVLAHIHGHLDEPSPVSALAALARLSVPQFKARFKQEMGVPPGEYVLRARVEEASRRLEQPGLDITALAYDLGFSSSQYFATVFKRFTGQTPSGRKQSRKSEVGTRK